MWLRSSFCVRSHHPRSFGSPSSILTARGDGDAGPQQRRRQPPSLPLRRLPSQASPIAPSSPGATHHPRATRSREALEADALFHPRPLALLRSVQGDVQVAAASSVAPRSTRLLLSVHVVVASTTPALRSLLRQALHLLKICVSRSPYSSGSTCAM